MRAVPFVLAIALAVATGCASRDAAPSAPDLVAVRIGDAAAPPRTPPVPPDVPEDAAVVDLGDAPDGARFFAVTRVFSGEQIDYLGVGVRSAESGSVRLQPDGDWRLFGRGDPAFGSTVQSLGFGWTYTVGVRGDGGHHRAYVARFPEGNPQARQRWEFLTADGTFSPSVRDAAPLFEAGPGGVVLVTHPSVTGPVAIYVRAATGGGCELLARAASWMPHALATWGPERRIARLPGLDPPGRIPFHRVPRVVADDVIDVPGAGRFRLVASAQRP